MSTVPDWLKTTAWAYCNGVAFQPQRRIVPRDGQPHLLDCQDRAYPLDECQPLGLRHMDKATVIWGQTQLSAFRLANLAHRLGDGFVLSDGHKRVWIRVEGVDPNTAATALARAFGGVVVEEA